MKTRIASFSLEFKETHVKSVRLKAVILLTIGKENFHVNFFTLDKLLSRVKNPIGSNN